MYHLPELYLNPTYVYIFLLLDVILASTECLLEQRKLQRADTILCIVVKHVVLISNLAYRKLLICIVPLKL